jgi:hypothetical protein
VTSCDAGLTWGSVRDLTEEAIGAALQGRWHLMCGMGCWGGADGERWVWTLVDLGLSFAWVNPPFGGPFCLSYLQLPAPPPLRAMTS